MLAEKLKEWHYTVMTKQRKSGELAAFLTGSDDPDERAMAWYAYAGGSAEELAGDVAQARQALHEGTPPEVIALASVDIQARARAAAEKPKE